MAKISAPFKIVGTLSDINYYVTADGNIAREKGKTGITKKQFKENPIFNKIRNHGSEFGHCVKKSRAFRGLARQFYDKAKEGSFAGRANKLLFEILEEDTQNIHGERKVEIGLETEEGLELLPDFEANKTRPLKNTCKRKITFNWDKLDLNIKTINPVKDINWPETEANLVHFQIAIANWNYKEDQYETHYSNQITAEKINKKQTLQWTIELPNEKHLWVAFLSISFSNKERKKIKLVPKKFNTTTLLTYKK